MKLLVAEDTVDLNRVVTAMLEHSGYSVDTVFDGEAALESIENNGYDAVLLDIMMPKKDGITVLKEMRAKNINIPVLLLTAKSEVDDRVEGLDAGADDYLPKPFAMKELLARVNAMTRRIRYTAGSWQYSNFSLDAQTLELSAENSVRLSIKEYELLQLFVTNREKELDTAFIIGHVWDKEDSADADTVFLYVNYLKRKMNVVGAKAVISGERGKSFRLMTAG